MLMVASLILVISGVMLAQFVVAFWRANMLETASQPVSEAFSAAQASLGKTANLDDFASVAAMSKLCPDVTVSTISLWPVRIYYQALRLISLLCSAAFPQGSSWARQEMVFCSRYLAVSVDRRLLSNQAYLAALRS